MPGCSIPREVWEWWFGDYAFDFIVWQGQFHLWPVKISDGGKHRQGQIRLYHIFWWRLVLKYVGEPK